LGDGTDWQDEVYRTAALASHQVSLVQDSGTNYLLIGVDFNEGILLGSGLKRYPCD
jgi:hypothetical protein